jgi:hypothetical protein
VLHTQEVSGSSPVAPHHNLALGSTPWLYAINPDDVWLPPDQDDTSRLLSHNHRLGSRFLTYREAARRVLEGILLIRG